MGKDYTNKYISTVKHETLTNQGKIDSLDPLWSHYQNLLGQFMYDMNFHLVRGQEVLKYTKVKPYQGDMTVLFERATKAYHKAVENGSENHQPSVWVIWKSTIHHKHSTSHSNSSHHQTNFWIT